MGKREKKEIAAIHSASCNPLLPTDSITFNDTAVKSYRINISESASGRYRGQALNNATKEQKSIGDAALINNHTLTTDDYRATLSTHAARAI